VDIAEEEEDAESVGLEGIEMTLSDVGVIGNGMMPTREGGPRGGEREREGVEVWRGL